MLREPRWWLPPMTPICWRTIANGSSSSNAARWCWIARMRDLRAAWRWDELAGERRLFLEIGVEGISTRSLRAPQRHSHSRGISVHRRIDARSGPAAGCAACVGPPAYRGDRLPDRRRHWVASAADCRYADPGFPRLG